jgi:type III pantothenate kinase
VILTIDIGNTHVDFAFFSGGIMTARNRMRTHLAADEPDHLTQLQRAIEARPVGPPIERALIASVVRHLGDQFVAHCRHCNLIPQQVDSSWDLGLHIHYDHPEHVGIDRLLSAAAAFDQYKTAVVVADAGTAITVDVIRGDGAFLGGTIAPGLRMMLGALRSGTSLLPEVELGSSVPLLGQNTVDGMRSGVLYGAAGLIDGLYQRLREQLQITPTSILTGGDAQRLFPLTRRIDRCDDALVLQGLRLAHERNELTL